MSNYNNSLQFYKGYYKDVNWSENFKEKRKENDPKKYFVKPNLELTNSTLPEREEELPFGYNIPKEHCLNLETTYPGLLLGSGITHGSGLSGEIKLGFFLDHTTGLPVIPGSSVKGVLRSVFPLGLKHAAIKEKDPKKKAALSEKTGWMTEYLQAKLLEVTPGQNWDAPAIEAFETWLFGCYETGVKVGAMSSRTIFYDALPISAARVKINGAYTNQYLATDFITPHKEPLKNPIPIQFLKVLPGVVFRFQFHFEPYKKGGQEVLSVKNIQDLFKTILLDIGVGAKTNVGYGQLIEPRPKPAPEQRRAASRPLGQISPSTETTIRGKDQPKPFTLYPKEGDTIELFGTIKKPNSENKPNRIVFWTEPKDIIKGYKDKKLNDFTPETILKVKVRLKAQSSNEVEEILSIKLY